jgi:dihydrofolate reductase
MRRIRYAVAMSLDAYIAGPEGESDWIIMDPDIDFREIFSRFDTVLMGRRTFEIAVARGGGGSMPGMKAIVVSRTLRQQDYPDVTILGEDFEATLTGMRTEPGKDIWLFGGGSLFRSLLDARLVDTVEVAVIPVLLGGGLPLLPSPARQSKLKLISSKAYKTGILSLEYAIEYETPKDAPGASGESSLARKGRRGSKAGKRHS